MSITIMHKLERHVNELRRLASCGRPVSWVRVELLDSNMNPVPDDEPREICVQGPLVMDGNRDNPELTAETLRSGWLHTGDVAVRDPDGFLLRARRKSSMAWRSVGMCLTARCRGGQGGSLRPFTRTACGLLTAAEMLCATSGCGGSSGTQPSSGNTHSSDEAGSGAPRLDAAPPSDGVAHHVDCTPNAYVSNSNSDSVSVIDTTTNTVVATIPTGKAPVNPTFTPDRQHVYVSNSQAGTLTVIDVKTNQTTTIPGGGDRPSGLAFSPDGNTLFVSLIGQNYTSPGSLVSIKLGTGAISRPIPMGADPERIALTPDGERLYVDNLLDGTMTVVDTTSNNNVIATLMLGSMPFNPLMSPDGTRVYVGVMSAGHIAVVDTKTNQILRTIPADSPNGMTFSEDFQSLFVSNALSGTVQEVSLTTNEVVKTQMVGGLPGNIALVPDGKHAYMVRPEGTTVDVLDTASLTTVDTITVGNGPSVVTICRGS